MRLYLLVAPAGFALACGRTDLEAWPNSNTAGAPTSAAGGGPTNAAGGGPTNAAGAPSSGPDFDFTPVLDQATTYEVHPSHSGSQQSVPITPPLVKIWSRHFETAVSYPVMANARVFVSVNSPAAQGGSVVAGLDATSGASLWTSDPIRNDAGATPVHLAYDRELLFAANQSGDVLALEPATGGVRWRARLPGVEASGSVPLAAGGALFVGAVVADHYTLFVLDVRDGRLVYTTDLTTGGDPTFGAGKIFSTGTCTETVALDATTGATVWRSSGDCAAGAGTRSMFHDGVLWLPGKGGFRVIDAASGSALGTLEDPAPLFMPSAAEDQVVVPSKDALRVFGASAGAFRWQIALPELPVLPALVTPDTVYLLAGGGDKFLYGVDLVRRQLSWQSSEPAAPADDWNRTGAEPLQAMAASGGRIVVAYDRSLSAFAAAD